MRKYSNEYITFRVSAYFFPFQFHIPTFHASICLSLRITLSRLNLLSKFTVLCGLCKNYLPLLSTVLYTAIRIPESESAMSDERRAARTAHTMAHTRLVSM